MNATDRQRLERLERAIGAIPLPASAGTQTRQIAGSIHFELDMREALPVIRSTLTSLARMGLDGWEIGQDGRDPDRLLSALEAWIARREAADWQPPVPSLQRVYEELHPGNDEWALWP